MSYSNDHSRVLQADSKLFDSVLAGTTSLHHNNSNNNNKKHNKKGKASVNGGESKVGGKFRFCLRFAAFVFSHVGLGFLVLVYTILGAFIFKHFEGLSFLFGLLVP